MTIAASVFAVFVLSLLLLFLALGTAIEVRSLRAAGVRMGSLRVGMSLPNLRAEDSRSRALVDVPRNPDEIVVLVSPKCPNCHGLVTEINESLEDEWLNRQRITIVCSGDQARCTVFKSSDETKVVTVQVVTCFRSSDATA
jgi:hypothetical protein